MGKNPTEHTPKFDSGWGLLYSSQKQHVLTVIDVFRDDPNHESLRAHTPRGYHPSVFSISADDDLRILLRVRPSGSILLLDVGDHKRIYGE